MSAFILAVPSKGRLQEQTLDFFADCGLPIAQTGGQRGYAAAIATLPQVEVRLLSAADIAAGLRDGEIHAGVTGEDLLRELGPGFRQIVLVKPLGFGRADLVVAAPSAWLDVSTMADLDAISASLRARTGRRLRVATKYVRQAQAFFDARGVDDYRIVESLGATEGAPAAGAAEAIVDITTTGATLAANHLKILSDGLILKSQAQIAASRAADWSDRARTAFQRMLDRIDARERGRRMRLVRAPIGAATKAVLEAIFIEAGGEPAGDRSETFVSFYCQMNSLGEVCAAAAEAGAGPIGVVAADYVYIHNSDTARSFKTAMSW